MVKREILLLFTLLVFLGCDRRYVKYDDAQMYLERNNLPEDVCWKEINDTILPEICPDSVIIDKKAMVIEKKLNEKFVRYIEPKISYYLYGDSLRKSRNTIYYALGKTNIQDGIISYFISDGTFLFLLNVKNNKLKSICLISAFDYLIPDSDYAWLKTYINYKAKSLLLIDKTVSGVDYDFWSVLGILKPKTFKYFFVSITIDGNGCVKAIPFNKKDFPDYMSY